MQHKTVCFTGHRDICEADIPWIRKALKRQVLRLYRMGYDTFYTGGALGFDTLAAVTVLQLKVLFPQITLILALPCHNQTRGWAERNIAMYEIIKQKADKVVYISQDYFRGCMQKRNRYLVENSDLCICYLLKKSGGTAYTVKYADSIGVETINLAKSNFCSKNS